MTPAVRSRGQAPIRVLFVSYDGALDPLGATQVVPYVRELTRRGWRTMLISFEKDLAGRATEVRRTRTRLEEAGVAWQPLIYHRRPRLPVTLWDCVHGAYAIRRAAGATGAQIVHCRGDVAATMARWAAIPRIRMLYDVRGLFRDERVESGSWRDGALVDRIVRRQEAENLARADGLVVLTKAGLGVIRGRRTDLPPYRVIPTCVDVTVFRLPDESPPQFSLVYAGSLGTWYMAREMAEFARLAGASFREPTLLLTPDAPDAVRLELPSERFSIHTSSPEDVPLWLGRARAAMFFVRPTPAKRASCPTKFAEALACGLPVVCNRGIGDLDQIVERERVGVLVDAFNDDAYAGATTRLLSLLRDPLLAARCRRLAETQFSLGTAVDRYESLYSEM